MGKIKSILGSGLTHTHTHTHTLCVHINFRLTHVHNLILLSLCITDLHLIALEHSLSTDRNPWKHSSLWHIINPTFSNPHLSLDNLYSYPYSTCRSISSEKFWKWRSMWFDKLSNFNSLLKGLLVEQLGTRTIGVVLCDRPSPTVCRNNYTQ